MIVAHHEVPFLAPLVREWQVIRDELKTLERSYFIEWPERFIYDGSWTVFPRYKFGTKVEE